MTGLGATAGVACETAPDCGAGHCFRTSVRISNGMGFTDDGIIIPPEIIRTHDALDEDIVSGWAVIKFNKKKRNWCWKAPTIAELQETGVAYGREWLHRPMR